MLSFIIWKGESNKLPKVKKSTQKLIMAHVFFRLRPFSIFVCAPQDSQGGNPSRGRFLWILSSVGYRFELLLAHTWHVENLNNVL